MFNQVFDIFKELLQQLDLQENICGYTLGLFLVCVVVILKIFIICCLKSKISACQQNYISNLQDIQLMV